jgi:hypothetical protein
MSSNLSRRLALLVLAVAAVLLGVGARLGYESPAGVLLLVIGGFLALLGGHAWFRAPAKRSESLFFIAFLALLLGGLALYLGWTPWREYATSKEEPQPISLRKLLDEGYGDNRYVLVKEFAFCNQHIAAEHQPAAAESAGFQFIWLPVVPADQRAANDPGSLVPAPRKVRVLVRADNTLFKTSGGPGNLTAQVLMTKGLRAHWENEGWKGFVRDASQLTIAEKERLLEIAPDTDVGAVLVLDAGGRPEAKEVYTLMVGGVGLLLFGLILGVLVLGNLRPPATPAAAPPA